MSTAGACRDPVEIHADLWRGWKGALAFDVGGNVGQTLPDLLARFTRVVSFEPAAESWQLLQRHAGDQVTCVNVAVSDADGTVSLWEEAGNLAQGQLISPPLHGWQQLGDKTPRRVPCRTLDSLAAEHGRPDLVVVDTEGHELRVLNGAAGLLAAGRTSWLIEFHSRALHDGCAAVLLAARYRLLTVRHPHYLPQSYLWHNHGFLRAEAPCPE